jgi:polyhydroxyalkanoate synthase subunit PhaC
MSRPAPDPTRWFTDLINSQKALLTATADGAAIPAAKQWTDALTSFTKWQMDSWNQLTGQWAAMFGMGPSSEPFKDRRFSGEAWTKDPRFEAVARAYLAQVDLLTKALDASPLDERSKGQWSFALRQVTDALSPANNLMTNPEAQQLALETGGKSLTEGLKLFTEDLAKGPDLDDRRVGFRGGRKRRNHTGHCHLPERDHPADPVHTQHRRGL